MTKEQILKRMAELRAELEDDSKEVDLEAVKSEIEQLEAQLQELEKDVQDVKDKVDSVDTEETPKDDEGADSKDGEDETPKDDEPKKDDVDESEKSVEKANEERKERKRIADELNQKSSQAKDITPKTEERKMEERFTIASPEYRTAWAKKLMGVNLDETEKRALGDAITTSATEFVESTADVQGINNAGLLIPESVRTELMENIYKKSPFLRDVRKLTVKGNVDLPFLYQADDASWGASETTCTDNEGQEYKRIQLTGHELIKNVVVSWKAESMTVDGFIAFIIDELTEKVGRALATAVLYGNGNGQPTGATNGLVAITGADPFDVIKDARASIDSDLRIGAKAYISEAVSDMITFFKDANNNRPYLMGIPHIANVEVEVDPFLTNNDILVGNPKYYVLNENEALRIDKEVSIKCRKTTYGAFALYDGKARDGAFALGQVNVI